MRIFTLKPPRRESAAKESVRNTRGWMPLNSAILQRSIWFICLLSFLWFLVQDRNTTAQLLRSI